MTTMDVVTVANSPKTLCTFKPQKNGGIFWKYICDNLGLTVRSGEIACSWDLTDNVTEDFDESTLDNVDYLTAPGKPTAVVGAAGASNTAGDHYIKVTFYTAAGETEVGTVSDKVTVTASTEDISVTAIPVSADPACTGRYIYMTEAGKSDYYLAETLADNVTTTATIAIDDTTLAGGTAAPSANASALANTTYLTFDTSMSAGVVSLTATSTSGDWTVMTHEICRLVKNS